MMDANMKPTGSDVETAQLLAKDWGLELEFIPTTGATRIRAVESPRDRLEGVGQLPFCVGQGLGAGPRLLSGAGALTHLSCGGAHPIGKLLAIHFLQRVGDGRSIAGGGLPIGGQATGGLP